MISRLALQLWGGGFYLLNKIALDVMEHNRLREKLFWFWRQMAWLVYLIGLPFVVIMFFREKNWIFGMVELGGAPAMVCGIFTAFHRRDPPKWLDRLALLAIPVGLVLSFLQFREWRTFGLEVFGSAGFLVGTYLLYKDRRDGYWWFMLMNVATGLLLYIEGYYLFVPQQVISVALIIDARRVRVINDRRASEAKLSAVRNPRPRESYSALDDEVMDDEERHMLNWDSD